VLALFEGRLPTQVEKYGKCHGKIWKNAGCLASDLQQHQIAVFACIAGRPAK
jgi:hypothetical protein